MNFTGWEMKKKRTDRDNASCGGQVSGRGLRQLMQTHRGQSLDESQHALLCHLSQAQSLTH